VVALPGGRVLWLELKAAKGDLRKGQVEMGNILAALGHEWEKLKSYRRFLEITTQS